MMVFNKITKDDVYDVMTYNWRLGTEIRDKVRQVKGLDEKQAPITTIYARLDALIADNLVERRMVQPEKTDGTESTEEQYAQPQYRKLISDDTDDVERRPSILEKLLGMLAPMPA